MKFGKTAKLAIVVCIVIIGVVIVYRMNTQEKQEAEELNTQMSAVQLAVPKLTADRAELESQFIELESDFAETKASLSEAKGIFPEVIESIEYDEVFFTLAKERNLEIKTLTASEPRYKNIASVAETGSDAEQGGVVYTITSFTVDVEGKGADTVNTVGEYEIYISQSLANILSFVNDIATGNEFITATVESAHISIPECLCDQEIQNKIEGGEVVDRTSALLTVAVYGYQGE